jgi:hypothetical protein
MSVPSRSLCSIGLAAPSIARRLDDTLENGYFVTHIDALQKLLLRDGKLVD